MNPTVPLRILTVCTHNRTRSVMMAALLDQHLRAAGVDAVIRTGGFEAEGQPATEAAVALMAERGIDLRAHRSHHIPAGAVAGAQLVLTAEHQHVVALAATTPGSFPKVFTLPELVQVLLGPDAPTTRGLAPLLAAANAARPTGAAYLRITPLEVADPTGQSPAIWRAAVEELDRMCTRLAAQLTPD